MTGLSNDSIYEIANSTSIRIKHYLNRIDKANKINKPYTRKKIVNLCERKLTNIINDLHWSVKIINFYNLEKKIYFFFEGNHASI